ncbi:PLDc N-terminal domain-containing protein [uncultured Jatrophihabitans sp.]|uniref:PLDc N-terminal domain-containing protein n=1 Tax=uncultured Jatrophihabitans sp. TaxID=1610747 RepID=UPI0035CA6C9D
MILADGAVGLLLLGLWLFCIIDVITTPDGAQRNLPKLMWLLIVLLLADVGSIVWLVAGRPWATGPAQPRAAADATKLTAAFPQYDRPGRHVAANPDDDEVFLRQVKARADAQRAAYETRRRADLGAERHRLLRRPEDGQPG